MAGDLSLFGDDEPPGPAKPVRTALPITDWQLDLIRKALDARGLTTMEERQALIETEVGRPVASLRALTHEEALRLLSKMGQQRPVKPRVSSSWDEREEDTWIDRL